MIREIDAQYSSDGQSEQGKENGPGKTPEHPRQEQSASAKRTQANIGNDCSGHIVGRGLRLYLLQKGPREQGPLGLAGWDQ